MSRTRRTWEEITHKFDPVSLEIWAQCPDKFEEWLTAEDNGYYADLKWHMGEMGVTLRQLIAHFLPNYPLPPDGSREADYAIGIEWFNYSRTEVGVRLPEHQTIYVSKVSDGRSLETKLVVVLKFQTAAENRTMLQIFANMRGDAVYAEIDEKLFVFNPQPTNLG